MNNQNSFLLSTDLSDNPELSLTNFLEKEDNNSLIFFESFTDIQQTNTGFIAKFDRSIPIEIIKIFAQKADISLTTKNNIAIKGSLIWNESNKTFTFIKTGQLLEADDYTIQISSNTSSDSGSLDSYIKTFSVTLPETDTILFLPDLTLAPGKTTDIPLILNNTAEITKVEFSLYYDRNFLDITAINLNDSLPTGWQITESEIESDNGIINVTIEGTDALTGSNLNLVNLEAVVPEAASYGATQVLNLENIVINDGNISVMDDDAVHQIMQAGDVTGDNKLDNLDVYQMMRVTVGLDDGFASFPTVDPAIFADLNQDGIISAFDAYYAVDN
jgi:hypothetical protein